MKQKLIATLCCLILSYALYAQTGWLPTVSFPANTNICDASPWKLVFYDEFNGDTLSNKWRTAVTYDEDRVIRGADTVIKGEHENHRGARYNETDGPCLYLDENIVVSNGTCKLLMKIAPNSTWTVRDSQRADYPLVTRQADLTSAIIKLPQEDVNRIPIGYSSGKFEARIKHPIKKGTWTAFWMWAGRGSINELDVTESRGGESNLNRHSVDHAMHAWWFGGYNPNNLPQEVGITTKYPNQSWTQWLTGSYFKMQNWHTYTYEWDTASIEVSVDGVFVDKIWKYGKLQEYIYGPRRSGFSNVGGASYPIVIGSECNLNGSYNITYGYPWNSTNANCDVRFECKFKPKTQEHYSTDNSSAVIDAMEIDYLKIWQRHPEKDNHTELCAENTYPATPIISGPEEVCGQVAYTLSPATAGGTWSSFNSNILVVNNPASSGCTVAKDAGAAFNLGWVAYSYGNGAEGCPLKTVYKRGLYCNESTDWNVMVPTVFNNIGEGRFHFIADLYHKRDVSGGTTPVVTWNISLNRGVDAYNESTAEHFTLYGQYASSPSFPAGQNQSYNLRWTIHVTDASGTHSRSGERNSKTALLQQEDDKNTFYLNAYIDDQDHYDTTVYYGVASRMISEEESNDTLYVNELIEKVRAEALEPYVITDGMETLHKGASGLDKPDDEGSAPALKSKLKVYPNPVTSDITIIADARFADKQVITIHVYDLSGKLIKTGKLNYRKGSMMTYDLSDIADGNYILELQQGHINDHIKIVKAKNG